MVVGFYALNEKILELSLEFEMNQKTIFSITIKLVQFKPQKRLLQRNVTFTVLFQITKCLPKLHL